MTKNILHNIEKNMSSFSKGQKLIARFILENYDKAAFMTASKLGTKYLTIKCLFNLDDRTIMSAKAKVKGCTHVSSVRAKQTSKRDTDAPAGPKRKAEQR